MGVLQIMIKKILKTGSICLLGLAVATGARMYVGSGLFASEKDNTVVNAAVRKVNLNYTSLSLGKGPAVLSAPKRNELLRCLSLSFGVCLCSHACSTGQAV